MEHSPFHDGIVYIPTSWMKKSFASDTMTSRTLRSSQLLPRSSRRACTKTSLMRMVARALHKSSFDAPAVARAEKTESMNKVHDFLDPCGWPDCNAVQLCQIECLQIVFLLRS